MAAWQKGIKCSGRPKFTSRHKEDGKAFVRCEKTDPPASGRIKHAAGTQFCPAALGETDISAGTRLNDRPVPRESLERKRGPCLFHRHVPRFHVFPGSSRVPSHLCARDNSIRGYAVVGHPAIPWKIGFPQLQRNFFSRFYNAR